MGDLNPSMQNIDILSHFTEVVRTDRITVFTLKNAERAAFMAKLPLPFRTVYITDEQLQWLQHNAGTIRADDIAEKIPSSAVLQSGEFGELLAYFLVPEKYAPNCTLRPHKLRWKEAKNIPAHFTDVVFFHQLDEAVPGTADFLISVETKARATRPGLLESSLQAAINDVEKDYNSRLAESLFHIKTKYKDERDQDALSKLARFMDAARFPAYLKHFKALALVDDQYGDHHIAQITQWPLSILDSFEVILIRFTQLKDGYEETYTNILAT